MLYRHVLVLHGPGDGLSGAEGLVHIRGNVDLSRLPAAHAHPGELLHLSPDGGLKAGHRQAQITQKLGDQAVFLLQQGVEQMGLLDLLVAVLLCDGLGGLDGLQGFLCKLIQIHRSVRSFRGAKNLG